MSNHQMFVSLPVSKDMRVTVAFDGAIGSEELMCQEHGCSKNGKWIYSLEVIGLLIQIVLCWDHAVIFEMKVVGELK